MKSRKKLRLSMIISCLMLSITQGLAQDPFCNLGADVPCVDQNGNPNGHCYVPCCDWIDTVKKVKYTTCLDDGFGGNDGDWGDGDACRNREEDCVLWDIVIRNKWKASINHIRICSDSFCCDDKRVMPPNDTIHKCKIIIGNPNHICDLCCPFPTINGVPWYESDSCRRLLGGDCSCADTLADGYCDSLCRGNCINLIPRAVSGALNPGQCFEIKLGLTGAMTPKCLNVCVYFGTGVGPSKTFDSAHCCRINLPMGPPGWGVPTLIPCDPGCGPPFPYLGEPDLGDVDSASVDVRKQGIRFSASVNSDMMCYVYVINDIGIVVQSKPWKVIPGSNYIPIEAENLPEGNYRVQILTDLPRSAAGDIVLATRFRVDRQ